MPPCRREGGKEGELKQRIYWCAWHSAGHACWQSQPREEVVSCGLDVQGYRLASCACPGPSLGSGLLGPSVLSLRPLAPSLPAPVLGAWPQRGCLQTSFQAPLIRGMIAFSGSWLPKAGCTVPKHSVILLCSRPLLKCLHTTKARSQSPLLMKPS